MFLLKFHGVLGDLNFADNEVTPQSPHLSSWPSQREASLSRLPLSLQGKKQICISLILTSAYPSQVSDVRMIHWTEAEQNMLKQLGPGGEELDGPYVPRPRSYIDLLCNAMRQRFPV